MRGRYLLNVVLLGFVLWSAAYLLPESNKPAEESSKVSTIKPNGITAITVERRGRETVHFTREGGRWRMRSPLTAYGDASRIDSILQILEANSYAKLQAGETVLENLGLKTPSVALKLDEHLITFGTTSPLDGRRYIRFNQFVHLVKDHLYPQLLQEPIFFVSRRLFPGSNPIRAIEFPGVKLFNENRRWRSLPEEDVNRDAIPAIIDKWQRARAFNISYYGQMTTEKTPGKTPEKTIAVSREDGETILFDVVSTGPEFILGRRDLGIQYHFNQEDIQEAIPGLFVKNDIGPVE